MPVEDEDGCIGELSFMPLAYESPRPVGAKPRVHATDQLIYETERALEDTQGTPEQMAQWIAERIEEYGAMQSMPVFDMEGNGPMCSWCGGIWGLCGHAAISEVVGSES